MIAKLMRIKRKIWRSIVKYKMRVRIKIIRIENEILIKKLL